MEYIGSLLAAILLIALFLSKNIATKVRLQLIVCLLIAVEIAQSIDFVFGISIVVFELMFWLSIRVRKKNTVDTSKGDKIISVSRKLILVISMLIASAVGIIITENQNLAQGLSTHVEDNYQILVIFILGLIIFISEQMVTKNE